MLDTQLQFILIRGFGDRVLQTIFVWAGLELQFSLQSSWAELLAAYISYARPSGFQKMSFKRCL
jgi:hypothetical protein